MTKTLVHLHTLDLRTHDLPSLKVAQRDQDVSHYLPVYIFDDRQIELSEFPNTSTSGKGKHANGSVTCNTGQEEGRVIANPNHRNRKSGPSRNTPRSRAHDFHRISPHRLLFLTQSVLGLRESYRRAGGDLIIGYGRPELVIPKLVESLQDGISAVYTQEEVTVEEANVLDRLQHGLKSANVELILNDSKVAVPVNHLPFDRSKVPDVYTNFRKKVEGLGVERGGMLVEPDHTTECDSPAGKRVRPTHLKPLPDLDLDKVSQSLGEGGGGFLSRDTTLDDLYAKLVRPLLDSPPLGGWSSTVDADGKPPPFPKQSPIPFEGGEESALARLDDYVGHASPNGGGGGKWENGHKAQSYKATRNGMIGEGFSTKFAEFFSLGCLSAREVGWRVGELLEHVGRDKDTYNNVYWILFELLWRDFFQHTTYKYSLASKASLFLPDGFSAQIDTYPKDARPKPQDWHYPNWDDPNDPARLWCEGKTGVPFIDANMRELRETGWMSNRGRQNVASFLVKDLYVDWRVGAEWFEMHLVDYDTCSNWGNWQYQAGVGNDPRSSRQFNPIKQAADYDPKGEYVRLWIPELKDVADEFLQTPWLLNDPSKLAGYPAKPIVELGQWKKHYPGGGGSKHNKGRGGGGGGRGGGRGGGGRGGRGGKH